MAHYIDEIDKSINDLSIAVEAYTNGIYNNEDGSHRILFYGDLQRHIKNIYMALNMSCLCGEYVEDDKAENSIKELSSKTGNLITLLSDGTDESKTIYEIINCLICDFNLYGFRIHSFWASVKNPGLQFLDHDIINDQVARSFRNKNIQLELYTNIFRCNYNLSYLDQEFSLNYTVFRRLDYIIHDLNDYKRKLSDDEKYIDALLHKCQILIAKFKYCDSISHSKYYNYYNNEDESVEFKVENSELFEKTQQIYNEHEYALNLTEQFKKCPEKCTNTFEFLIKCFYYKNVVKNKTLLDELVKEFSNFRSGISKDKLFDYTNARSCFNYLSNCRLSLLLNTENLTLTDVWGESLKIKSIQDATNVRNYFPYMKIAEWYSRYLSETANSSDDMDSLSQALYNFEKHLTTATEYLRESERNAGCFIPFKPLYKECLEKYELDASSNIDIFVNSSYIIPVDYEKAEERIEKLHSDLICVKAIIEARKKIGDLVGSLSSQYNILSQKAEHLAKQTAQDKKDTEANVQKELKENQKNNIEILAIFSGLVVFASGTIQIFTGTSSVKDATIFMLLFASSLSLLSLLIWIISSSKNKYNRRVWIFLSALLVIIGINLYAIFGNWGKVSLNDKKKESTEIVTK